MSSRRTSAPAFPLALALALAACTTQPPRIAPPPPAATVAPPPPAPVDWADLPLSPGGWHYAADASGSSASFGVAGAAPAVVLRCLKPARQIMISLSAASSGGAAVLVVRTSYGSRTLAAAAGSATLDARDRLLDQIAFSRGRFTIGAGGAGGASGDSAGAVVMPAWAEPGRVVEDCRG